jgi:hypothetical protein
MFARHPVQNILVSVPRPPVARPHEQGGEMPITGVIGIIFTLIGVVWFRAETAQRYAKARPGKQHKTPARPPLASGLAVSPSPYLFFTAPAGSVSLDG